MTLPLNYQKRKNTRLFASLQNHKGIELSEIQNYIPIYNTFFSLNANNYNSINLNHLWYLHDVTKGDSENIFTCKLKNSDFDTVIDGKAFFKMAPLLDPCKYIVGKYNHLDPHLFTLPSLEDNSYTHSKLLDRNNSSYVDGFFVFLTSQLLNYKRFIHGVDYYGSFLTIKNNFKLNVADDLDYLVKSDFFNKQKNILFQIDDYSHLMIEETPKILVPIKICSSEDLPEFTIPSINNEIFEDLFSQHSSNQLSSDLIDITSVNPFLQDDQTHSQFSSQVPSQNRVVSGTSVEIKHFLRSSHCLF
jgi:hypothetical protein